MHSHVPVWLPSAAVENLWVPPEGVEDLQVRLELVEDLQAPHEAVEEQQELLHVAAFAFVALLQHTIRLCRK